MPMAKRAELRKQYGIKPTGQIEVVNNQLVVDGVNERDVEVIDRDVLLFALGLPESKEPERGKLAKKTNKKVAEAKAKAEAAKVKADASKVKTEDETIKQEEPKQELNAQEVKK